jgi:hypothetical protein
MGVALFGQGIAYIFDGKCTAAGIARLQKAMPDRVIAAVTLE